MKGIFELIYNTYLEKGEKIVATEADRRLLKLVSQFEDTCAANFGEKSTDILELVDEILKCNEKINQERFVSGMKVGIALTNQSHEFVEELKKK